ncbi:MAG: hypothetical protein AXA67_10220 [Methylothermaceae bacteria B42]|nr:MAG: hypothetical protein AXA67_10220 [Methylothermaceae bacteria B42]HHJ40555.1 hypothetical protein [Methylothermaceae bacterium]
MKINRIAKGIVLGAIVVVGSTAQAGVFVGDTVKYTISDDVGLFGTAFVDGDTLKLLPTDFKAESINGAGAALTNETITITVESLTGQNLLNASLEESGDYMKYNIGGGVNEVSVTGQLRAGALFDAIEPTAGFSPTGLSISPWEATANLDLSGLTTSKTVLTLENLLAAVTTVKPDIAFIEKKFVALDVTAIPIPGAVWLFGSAVLGLIAAGRSKRVAS